MELSGEAIEVMAQCISRGEHITVETNGAVEVGLDCAACGRASATSFALHGITAEAVYEMGTVKYCTFCSVPLCRCGHNVPDHEHGPCEECDCVAFVDEDDAA